LSENWKERGGSWPLTVPNVEPVALVDGPVAAFAEREMRAAGRSVIRAMVQAGW
jgi:hypothetical protein